MRPSGMKRLSRCPGSRAVVEYAREKYGELRDHAITLVGDKCHDVMRATIAHAIRDLDGLRSFLLPLVDATRFAEVYVERFYSSLSKYDRWCIAQALIWFWQLCDERGIGPSQIRVEQHLRGQEALGLDCEHGTADVLIVIDGRSIVVDWKFGYLEQDGAPDNDQLATYAVLAHLTDGTSRTDVFVVQPRQRGRMATGCAFGARELESTKEWCRSVTAKARDPRAELCPSWDACEHCDGIIICRAAWEYIMEARTLIAELEAKPDPDILSRVIEAAKMGAALERKAIPLAKQLMQDGIEPPAFALRSGAEDARVIDRAGALLAARERGIEDDYIDACTPSVAQLRERLGEEVVAEVFGPFIEIKQKAPSIVARKGE